MAVSAMVMKSGAGSATAFAGETTTSGLMPADELSGSQNRMPNVIGKYCALEETVVPPGPVKSSPIT